MPQDQVVPATVPATATAATAASDGAPDSGAPVAATEPEPKPVPPQVPEHTVIHLAHPFTTPAGRTVAQLSMRRWTVADYVAMGSAGATPEAQELALFASLVGLTLGELDAMDVYDYGVLQAVYQAREPSADVLAADAKAAAVLLQYPFTTPGGQRVTQIALRRAKVWDLKQASLHGSTQQAREVALMALTAGFVPEDVGAMDGYDYRRLEARFRGMSKAAG